MAQMKGERVTPIRSSRCPSSAHPRESGNPGPLGPRFRGDERMLLWQFDNLVHALYAVIDRDLKDRMVFLDPQPRFFRSFIGRIRVFHLPIHLEAKSAAVRLLALRDRLRDGFLRRGWHGYGRARLSRRRCHLMISFGRARTVSAAPLLHHARSNERVSQQIRTIWAAAPDAAQAPADRGVRGADLASSVHE